MNYSENYQKRFSPLTIVIAVFSLFILVIVIISIILSGKTDDDLPTGGIPLETNFLSKISNEDILNQFLSIDDSSIIKNHLKVLSVIYPELNNISIDEKTVKITSLSNASFLLTTNSNKIFYVETSDDFITIKNNSKEIIYTSSLIKNNIITLSPHLIEKYFPYNDSLSDQSFFKAELQENKKDIKITIPSCVSKEDEKESIEKTKSYIKNLGSDPTFFNYTTATFCF